MYLASPSHRRHGRTCLSDFCWTCKASHNVTVITSNEADGKTCPKHTEVVQGVRIYRFPLFMPKKLRELWLVPGVRKILPKLQADIVHAHGYRCLSSCTAIYLAHVKNIPSIITPHGIYPARSLTNGLAKSLFDHTLGLLLLSLSDKIVSLSQHNTGCSYRSVHQTEK